MISCLGLKIKMSRFHVWFTLVHEAISLSSQIGKRLFYFVTQIYQRFIIIFFCKNLIWPTTGSKCNFEAIILNSPETEQVAQAQSRKVQNIRICMGEKNNCFCSPRMLKELNKNRLTLLNFCVSSFQCGFRADIWPFNRYYWNWFVLSITENLY